jgi:very-short-patch-repair endonuclease
MTESPIERLFRQAIERNAEWPDFKRLTATSLDDLVAEFKADSEVRHGWNAEVRIGTYRADFVFVTRDTIKNSIHKFVVECDGHEFHDKTKQQAARDKARDRALVVAGAAVMRFTGSEIHRDADECYGQVVDALHSVSDEGINELLEAYFRDNNKPRIRIRATGVPL